MEKNEKYLRSWKSVEHRTDKELEESLKVVIGINERIERGFALTEAAKNAEKVRELREMADNTVSMSERKLLEIK